MTRAARLTYATLDYVGFLALATAAYFVCQQVAQSSEAFNHTSIARGFCVLVVSALSLLASRRLFGSPAPLLAVMPVASAATGNLIPFLSWAVFLFASYGVGLATLRTAKLRVREDDAVLRSICALAVGIAINSFVTWLAMRTPWNYPWGYRGAYGLELLLFGRLAWRQLPTLPQRWSLGQQAILLHALLFLPFAFVPSYCWDDLVTHLHIPHQTKIFGRFDFSPEFMGGLNIAFIPMGSYTSLFLLGGENAIRMLNLSLFSLGAIATEHYARRLWGSRVALCATALALSTPYTYWILSIPFVDAFFFFTAAIFFLFVHSFLRKPDVALLPTLALLAAIGYLCKQQFINLAIPLGLPIAVAVFLEARRSPLRALTYSFGSGALFLGLLAPPVLQNYFLTGNPLYPLFNGVFKSPFLPLTNFVDARWNQPLSLATFWNITFKGSKFVENIDFSFGFSAFLLLPMACVMGVKEAASRRSLIILGLLALCLGYSFIAFKTTGFYLRYFLGIIPPLSLCLALGAESLVGGSRLRSLVLSLFLSALVALNTCALLSTRNTADPYPIMEVLRGDVSGSSMNYYQEVKRLFRVAHRRHGDNSLGLLVDSQANYFARSRVVSNLYYFPPFSEQLAAAQTPGALSHLLFTERGVDYIIMPTQQPSGPFASEAFQSELEVVAKSANFGLYERKGTRKPARR